MAFNLAGTRVAVRGQAPVIAEPVVGTITLRTSQPSLVVYPITADGQRGTPLPAAVSDGRIQIPLSADSRTIFYEVIAE